MYDADQTSYSTDRDRSETFWEIPTGANVLAQTASTRAVPQRNLRRRRAAGIVVAALVLGLLVTALWPAADSLGTTEVGPWNVSVRSGGSRSVMVLAYGKEAGLHLIRVPASDGKSGSRVLTARLGEAPLYLVSLGRAPLEVSAMAPPGKRQSWNARGRVVQAFKDERGTGVRTW